MASGALENNVYGYSSMSDTFLPVVGAKKQVMKACELFNLPTPDPSFDYCDPDALERFILPMEEMLQKSIGQNNYQTDRYNHQERGNRGLDLSRRKYNKLWRALRNLEAKINTIRLENRKRDYQMIANHGLAHRIIWEEFNKDEFSACFIAYYTARCNLRSLFTGGSQVRAFDEVSEVLFEQATGKPFTISKQSFLRRLGVQGQKYNEPAKTPNWWAIAHVYPSPEVLKNLATTELSQLLMTWTDVLHGIADLLRKLWETEEINRNTMVVKRGNDSSTWNHTAGAWNKARDAWMNLIYTLGIEKEVLQTACLGKVMRLMAADVAYGLHHGSLDPNTTVWSQLPLPWEILSGEKECSADEVKTICKKARLDPEKIGWIAPRPHGVERFTPTPELVHGVVVGNPFLATVLKKHKFFSGKSGFPPQKT